jgi:DinB superfamily
MSARPELQYPIGKYEPPVTITAEHRSEWIAQLEQLASKLRQAVADLSDAELDTPYRAGGWTVRQVVHHLPDSHLNSYIRFRLALTEDTPTIKPYAEAKWAELADAKLAPIGPSLNLLESLHLRLTTLLRSLTDADFARAFRHPELGEKRLDWTLGLYAWHSRHHLAHITNLRDRNGW